MHFDLPPSFPLQIYDTPRHLLVARIPDGRLQVMYVGVCLGSHPFQWMATWLIGAFGPVCLLAILRPSHFDDIPFDILQNGPEALLVE